MNNQIYVDNTLIHPETDSEVVLHNNSNLKKFLNGLVSTDNMPAFMQQFLMSADYVAANQALHTIPETYFDYAFNTWTATGSPTLSGGSCYFNGSNQKIESTPGWKLGGDSPFTFAVRFKFAASPSAHQTIFTASQAATSGTFFAFQINKDSLKPEFVYRASSSNRYDHTASSAVSANQSIHLEFSFDPPNTRRIFINGVYDSSYDSSTLPAMTMFRIGAGIANSNWLDGSIDYIHISNIVRHTSGVTPPSFDDNTLSLLLFD